ncbi:MAG TPA: PAS domain S-box protein [Anaerolineae bacterium]|nr:PAS domain S-box protein [Anaerolineae bacterium]
MRSTVEFWRKLDLVGMALQTAAYARNEVLITFKKHIQQLGLWGGVVLLEEMGDQFEFAAVVTAPQIGAEIARWDDKIEAEIYAGRFDVRQWGVFQQVLGTLEPFWAMGENRSIWLQLVGIEGLLALPEAEVVAPVIYAPILYQNDCLGLVYLGGDIKRSYMEAVAAFGRHLGIALENARRFQGHQEMEVSYRHQRDLAQQYLDIAEVIFLILDREGRVSTINRKGWQLLGYDEGELLGKNWFMTCLPHRLRKSSWQRFDEVCRGQQRLAVYGENPVLTREGDERLIAWHNAPLRDERGRIIGTISSGQDITERRQAERALADSERRFRAIFRQTFHLLGLLDVNGRLLEANERALAFTGVSLAEVRGKPIWEALSGMATSRESRNEVQAAVSLAAEGEMIKNIETELLTMDGQRRLVEFSVKPISDDDGGVELLLLEGRDITAQRQMADMLYRSEKMATLQRLAEGVGYHFEQVLQQNKSENKRPALADVPAGVVAYIESLESVVNGARQLNQQILTYVGHHERREEVLDLNLFLQERDGLWQQLCGSRVEWQMVLESEPFWIKGDPEKLAAMLGIFIKNSVEGMVAGDIGQIGLATRRLEIGWQDHSYWQYTTNTPLLPGSYATLLLQDTGLGMDQETLKRIFEPFFSTKPGRRGLGLPVALGIVRQHRGGIAVTSQIGHGSTIQVVFPLVARPRRDM